MKSMIHRLLAILCFASIAIVLSAQEEDGPMPPLSQDRLQEIKAQKSAFITRQLQLTPEQARSFWPIYDQYESEMTALRQEIRADRSDMKKGGDLSEADAAKAITAELGNRQRQLDLRKKYVEQFKKSIGSVKTLALGRAERDFNRELLSRMRQGNEGRRGRPGPPR